METKTLRPTGPAAALKTAYQFVTQNLKYSHKRLVRENFGMNMEKLKNIKRDNPGKPSTDEFCMQCFLQIIKKEYHQRIQKGDTGREILRVLAQIALQDHYLSLDEQGGVKRCAAILSPLVL